MGIYYNPPQPVQQGPHALPSTPGNAPPLEGASTLVAFAGLYLAITNACWAQPLEPRIQWPNNAQVKIAPLTLTYGQQPKPVSEAPWYAQIRALWPQDGEPRLPYPDFKQVQVAPLTLTYGSQPTPVSEASWYALIGGLWPQAGEPRLGHPHWPQSVKIAPLTLPYGDQPTPSSFFALRYEQWRGSWAEALEPRLLYPNQPQPNKVVPLTLVYGDQPPRIPRLLPPFKALFPDTWGTQTLISIAPLTLTYGQPPPGRMPALPPSAALAAASWGAQGFATNAAWNVPAVIVVATQPSYSRSQAHIWASWQQDILSLTAMMPKAFPGVPINEFLVRWRRRGRR